VGATHLYGVEGRKAPWATRFTGLNRGIADDSHSVGPETTRKGLRALPATDVLNHIKNHQNESYPWRQFNPWFEAIRRRSLRRVPYNVRVH